MTQEETDMLKRAIDTHVNQLRRNGNYLTGSWNLPALKDCYAEIHKYEELKKKL